MTGSPLRVGIAGLGRLGRRHATMLARQVAGAELVAACSPVADELAWARDALGVPHVFAEYEAMLTHPALDAVFLVTPTSLHANGFARLYKWLIGVDLLVVRADRSEPLVVMPLSTLIAIAKTAEQIGEIHQGSDTSDIPETDEAWFEKAKLKQPRQVKK